MLLHIPNVSELNLKLKNLGAKAKSKYANLGIKLLVFSVNTINHFAQHLIVLQGKNINDPFMLELLFGPKVEKVPKNVRPFIFSSAKGLTKLHITNPEKYHPILINHTNVDEKDILEVSKDAENILTTLEAGLNVSLPKEEEKSIGEVSGAHQSVKKTVVKKSKKKITKKKVVRGKKGTLHKVRG